MNDAAIGNLRGKAMVKKTIRDIDISGKRLLIRVDFNVPLREIGSVASDRRIRAALPTIRYGLENNASMVLMTHLGQPGGQREKKLELGRVAYRLQERLSEAPVEIAGGNWRQKADRLKPGQVLLLENIRFDPGEENGDEQFARRLGELGEIYVNDAFATCHRKHASMFAVPKLFPAGTRVIGLLVEKELAALDNLLQSPQQQMVAVLGGVKVADKIGVVETLLERVQKLLIGGAMALKFMKARGLNVGASSVEDDQLDLARRLLDRSGDRLVLPQDHVIAREPEASAESKVVDENIPSGWHGLDVGPKTIERYTAAIRGAGTVVWNGPLGKFEDEPFRKGTEAVILALAESDGLTVAGGGESGEAVEQFDLIERIDRVSTGDDAFLEYLEKGSLPALPVMDEK